MKIVKVNNLGYLIGPSVTDATIEVEVTDELAEKLNNWPATKIWQYDWDTKAFNLVQTPYLDGLRFARTMECFEIINRGQGWYLLLTEDQKAELIAWYQAWLDVTETGVIPVKPEWIK
jgi:hypothetical protein